MSLREVGHGDDSTVGQQPSSNANLHKLPRLPNRELRAKLTPIE